MTEEKISIKKNSIYVGFIVVLLILLGISMMTGGFGIGSNGNVVNEEIQPNPSPTKPSVDMKALVDDDAFKGDENAPVTIVEFSDYECPFCQRFYQDTFGQIESEYINTGKVKFVYRDFPLNFHQNAQKAAEAAECAGEQGSYYEMHDLLFEKGVAGGVESFKEYASEIGLNQAEFDECLDSGKMESEVKKDLSDGQAAGVRGTPAFFINGELVSGAQPYSVFKTKIDSLL